MTQQPQKSDVFSERVRNKLTIRLIGSVSKKELDALYTDTRFAVADLQPGFDVICDFTACQLIYLGALPTFRRMIHYVVTHGVTEVVLVMQQKRIISRQIVQFSLQMQGYRPNFAATIEEAETTLINSVKRNGVRFHFTDLPGVLHANSTVRKTTIHNISTSGAAVNSVPESLEVDMDAMLEFMLESASGTTSEFQLKARVVRVQDERVAVEFVNLDEPRREQLWQSLLYESGKER